MDFRRVVAFSILSFVLLASGVQPAMADDDEAPNDAEGIIEAFKADLKDFLDDWEWDNDDDSGDDGEEPPENGETPPPADTTPPPEEAGDDAPTDIVNCVPGEEVNCAPPPGGEAGGVLAQVGNATLQTPNDAGGGKMEIIQPEAIPAAVEADPNLAVNADGSLAIKLPVQGAATSPNSTGFRYEFRGPDVPVADSNTFTFGVTLHELADTELDATVFQLLSMDTGKGRDILQVRVVQEAGVRRLVVRLESVEAAVISPDHPADAPIEGTITVEAGTITGAVNGVVLPTLTIPADVTTVNAKSGIYVNKPDPATPGDAVTTATVFDLGLDSATPAPAPEATPTPDAEATPPLSPEEQAEAEARHQGTKEGGPKVVDDAPPTT